MRSGGGTHLKMLDYLAAGLAVVTTPVGARGLDLQSGVHAAVHELGEFSAALRRLASAPERRASLRKAGREHVMRHFTWAGAARALQGGILELSQPDREHRHDGKPIRLLVLNDFPVAPGLGGGQARIRGLYRALPEGYEITLLCLGDAAEERVTRIDHRFVEIAVPKTIRHRSDQDEGAIGAVSIADIVAGRHCLGNERLVRLVRAHAATADIVVFEHPYLAPLLGEIPAEKPVVYSSGNVESEIKQDLLAGRRDCERCISEVTAFESAVAERASLIAAVTASDAEHFRRRCRDARVVHVANGVDCSPAFSLLRFSRLKDRFGGRRVACFVGSAHPPNVEAAEFIIGVLAPKLPDVWFLVVGSVCEAMRHAPAPPNVLMAGVVTREEKDVLQHLADVGINPVISGGGSSLKVPDALAAGLPLLSTPFGARGFDTDGEQGVVLAELPDFPEALRALLDGPDELRRLSRRAIRHARRELDWQVLAGAYSRELRRLSRPATGVEPGRRLLVVTHRYTQPPRGGAEVYLDRVLSELGATGRWSVTVATVDATDVADRWHFSSRFSNDGSQTQAAPPHLDRLYRFELSPDEPRLMFERCRRLSELWGRESLKLGRQALSSRAPAEPVLLGGWHFPEPSGASVARWTGCEAEIFLPARARAVELGIRGYALEPKRLRVVIGDDDVRFDRAIAAGALDLSLEIGAGQPGVLSVRTPATAAADDPRALGVFIREIQIGDARGLSLDSDLMDEWRRRDARGWIDALASITRERAVEDDELFSRSRGPHSESLRRWLFEHVGAYDVVLAHGLPFSTLPMAAEAAYESGVPCVLLPHIHVEDRYFHWQSYQKAFRQATLTLAAPAPAKPWFFDRLGGVESATLPGGGIDLGEFTRDMEPRRAAFREVYRSADPFVLVLGRKSGAKRYRAVIEAVRSARDTHPRLRLVMIGPDEDRAPIGEGFVTCLGAQPREVVLGALHEALVLASMSSSESFGIVILEAWMAGRPVAVSGDCLAFQELVVHGRNGWLCATVDELADAFRAALDSPGEAAAMGDRGRRQASRYGWRAVAASVEDALHAALESRASMRRPAMNRPATPMA
jgi:glycosyltransferase involved in cell wall biosynthesis